MLLRNSISNTKKFFQKTLQSFKSFFSGGSYQRIPKTPPHNNPCSYSTVGIDMNAQTSFNNKGLDKFYNDFNNQWDPDKEKAKKRNRKQMISSSSSSKQENNELHGNFMKFSKVSPVKNYQIQRREDYIYNHNKVKSIYEGKRSSRQDESSKHNTRDQGRSYLVAQKLKELEMMDISNVDHVLDIEEVLHYYSRLTCPAYLDIVDKFFMDMYAEFFGPPVTPRSVNSKPRLHSLRS